MNHDARGLYSTNDSGFIGVREQLEETPLYYFILFHREKNMVSCRVSIKSNPMMVPHGSLRRPKALRIAGIKFTDIQLDRYNREKVRISDGFEFH